MWLVSAILGIALGAWVLIRNSLADPKTRVSTIACLIAVGFIFAVALGLSGILEASDDVGATLGLTIIYLGIIIFAVWAWWNKSDEKDVKESENVPETCAADHESNETVADGNAPLSPEKDAVSIPEEKKEDSGGNGPLIVIVMILLALVFSLIGWGIHNAPNVEKEQKYLKELREKEQLEQKYQEARQLMEEYKFKEASALFYRIPSNYKDSAFLESYCTSRYYYEEGDARKAYQQIELYLNRIGLCSVPDSKEYQALMYEQKALLEKQKEQKFFKDLKNKLPYKGMDEKYMHQTKLGKAEVTENSGKCRINGIIYSANRYSYYEKGKLVYAAICANGKVLYVEDHFGKTITFASPSKKKAADNFDPLDAASYSNEFDFYDDNYDYFSDYYEAEEYYFNHQ